MSVHQRPEINAIGFSPTDESPGAVRLAVRPTGRVRGPVLAYGVEVSRGEGVDALDAAPHPLTEGPVIRPPPLVATGTAIDTREPSFIPFDPCMNPSSYIARYGHPSPSALPVAMGITDIISAWLSSWRTSAARRPMSVGRH